MLLHASDTGICFLWRQPNLHASLIVVLVRTRTFRWGWFASGMSKLLNAFTILITNALLEAIPTCQMTKTLHVLRNRMMVPRSMLLWTGRWLCKKNIQTNHLMSREWRPLTFKAANEMHLQEERQWVKFGAYQ